MNLGAQVKKLRRSLKLTQKEFARRIPGRALGRVDYTYIGKVERGHSLPSIKLLTRMAEIYGVSVGYFFLEDSKVVLKVKEEIQSWTVEKLAAFAEELTRRVEESIKKALTEIQH